MRPIKPSDGVIFIDNRLENAFNSLSDDDWLKKALKRTIERLKENAYCGERIPHKLIPKEYIEKYNIDNLFWYKLPMGWRLVYSVVANNIEIISFIIEYFDHKTYERRFNY